MVCFRFNTAALLVALVFTLNVTVCSSIAISENAMAQPVEQAPTPKPPILKSQVTDFFKFDPRKPFEGRVIDLNEQYKLSEDEIKKQEEAKKAEEAKLAQIEADRRKAAKGRMSDNAPQEFQNLVISYRLGDMQAAEKYADEFVNYLTNLIFDIKQVSALIGEALVRKQMMKEDDLVGTVQTFSYAMAKARNNLGTIVKPTHEASLRYIKTPDPKNKAEIYYFFTVDCFYCREMASDVERLWRTVQRDPKIKMKAFAISATPKAWMREYLQFTGLTIPVSDGQDLAKSFRIGLVPALVVVSPTNNSAYVRTGQTSFKEMYEFVKTVQGLPIEMTPQAIALARQPIGELELNQTSNGKVFIADTTNTGVSTGGQRSTSAELTKF